LTTPSKKIIVSPLNRIKISGGDVMHALKNTDQGYAGFGETYFSFVDNLAVKAWKMHRQMTMNLVVPIGRVKFVFYLPEENIPFRVECIGEHNYVRLTVPPNIWFGFSGIGQGTNLIMNIADMPHDPNEVERASINEFEFEW
jgi:dTDP-4-dehydrorhamnose 3,5-epimerase